MIQKKRWPDRGDVGRLTLASLLAVTAGYLFARPMEIPMGSPLLSALTTRDFHDAEGDFRWTRERSSVIFPDPGPGLDVDVELRVSGFRPRGQQSPLLAVDAEGERLQTRPGRGETLVLQTETRGWWSSDLEVELRSETYTPGDMDRRALGVRVNSVRLVPRGNLVGLRRPPFNQLVYVTLGLLLMATLAAGRGTTLRSVRWVGYTFAIAWGLGFALARPYAALLSPFFVIAAAVAAFSSSFLPGTTSVVGESLRGAVSAARRGLPILLGWPTAVFVFLGALGVSVAYLSRPLVVIDLGSGRETTLVENFHSFDQEGGVKFRRASRGARIDLGDFGGGTEWTLAVTASLSDRAQEIVLARVGDQEIRTGLSPRWSRHELRVAIPAGWRPGPVIEFPSASEAVPLRIEEVSIQRGRSLPPLRIVVYVLAAALLLSAVSVGLGLRPKAARWLAGIVLAAELAALALDPLLAVPFVGSFLVVAVAGAAFMLLLFGLLTALARRHVTPSPVPAAVVASGLGFTAWLSSTLFPLYRGGHFVFHSSIAEEIWQGKFLTYYLPYPGSMLSRQAQWGGIIVPHSCLYHTLVAPLAAFPREWFYGLEKAVLAWMLAVTAVIASLVATRTGSPRAGAYAGVFAACLPPTFQLLGLGHLMTLFGVFAGALALGFVTLELDRLTERATWWWAFGLLTLCFLSYTASLLLTASTLILALPLLYRRSPAASRALMSAVVAASVTSFFLYYVNWTLPFLRESLPAVFGRMGASAAESSLASRVYAIPSKLAYTYGNALLPLLGLAGVAWARPRNQRILLVCWAGMLVLYSVVDLFFNFLLKHHYFVIPAVSVGLGLFTEWLSKKKRWGRPAAAALVALALVLGARAALRVALG